MNSKINFNIPKEVSNVTKKLQDAGFEAFLVGGCVRDLFLNQEPKDWDITTNANPEETQTLFEHTFYENNFGTVGVVNDNVSRETLKIVEVTTYRIESKYSDNRRPDQVKFSKKLEDDLKRRDFTINALCYNPQTKEIIDLYDGVFDLQNKIIKAIGRPDDRFQEDALRMLRAVRFIARLDFSLEEKTFQSIQKNIFLLENISRERIRDEFIKILLSKYFLKSMFLMKELNILQFISSDFVKAIDIKQGGGHKYDVFEHLIRSANHAIEKDWSLNLRLAALFHDIGKPASKRWNQEKNKNTFYGHEVIGAELTRKNLNNLKFDNKTIEKVVKLVRNHMFFSDPDKITLSAVRRIIRNIGGAENVWDLIKLRICDRIGMGRPKEEPYRLRKYQAMMEEAMRTPISVKDLNINGKEIMEKFNLKPSPKIGMILNALMNITLTEPEKNTKEFHMKHIKELLRLSDQELQELSKKGAEKIFKKDQEEIKTFHVKHHVD